MKKIDGFEISPHIIPMFPDDSWVSIDVEVFGLRKGRFHKPEGKFASLALTADGKTVYMITDVGGLKLFQRVLEDSNCGIICQNGSFDIFHLRRWMNFPDRKRYWDTMLCDRILWGGYYESYDLKSLVRRYLRCYMDKDIRQEFEKATELTDEMIYYNAIDTVSQWRVAQPQMGLFKKSHTKIWNEIDAPAMWAFLEFKGPMVDAQKWDSIADRNEQMADEIAKEFGFNPRSPKQVKEYLASVGIQVDSTGVEVLEKFRDKSEVVARILEYRGVQKLASTYGKAWIQKHIEEDGRVRTSYDVNRAESGRTASSEPNLHNIPIRKSPIFRECFIAAPGNVLVGGDFGQQEVRSAAYLSKDENLIDLFRSGRDIYCEIASYIYKEQIEKCDVRRQNTKSVVLGIIYGLTPFGLARDIGCTEEEAEQLFIIFFEHFPKVRAWMDKQQMKTDYVRTPAGRKCWLNPYSSQVRRNALNSPNQGAGADMLKKAVAYLYEYWDRDLEPFPAIMQIHDEIVLEVKEENAEYAKGTLEACMLNAGEYVIPGVPVSVDVKIGTDWSMVH